MEGTSSEASKAPQLSPKGPDDRTESSKSQGRSPSWKRLINRGRGRPTPSFQAQAAQAQAAQAADRPKRYVNVLSVYNGLSWERFRDQFLSKRWPEEDFSKEPTRKKDTWQFETPEELTADDRRVIHRLMNFRNRYRSPSPHSDYWSPSPDSDSDSGSDTLAPEATTQKAHETPGTPLGMATEFIEDVIQPSPDSDCDSVISDTLAPETATQKAHETPGTPLGMATEFRKDVIQPSVSTSVEDEIGSPISSDVETTDDETIFSSGTKSQFSVSDLTSVSETSDSNGKDSAKVLLVHLLYRDEALYDSYHEAAAQLSSTKLQTNLQGLFKIYGRELRQEAIGEKQLEASAFIRASARHVAREITGYVSGDTGGAPPRVPTESHKAKTEKWLRKEMGPPNIISQPEISDEIENFPNLDELDDKEVHMTYQSLNDLMEFLRSSVAFDHLKNRLNKIGNGVESTGGNRIIGKKNHGPKTSSTPETGTLQAAISSDCVDHSLDHSGAQILSRGISDLVTYYCHKGEHLERPEEYQLSSAFVRSAVSAWIKSTSHTNTLLDTVVQVAPFTMTWGIESTGGTCPSHTEDNSTPEESSIKEKPLLFASAWQAPHFVSTLCSKQHHGKGLQSFNEEKIFDAIATTVIITGSHDLFEISTCQELLQMLWPGVGILALRAITKMVAFYSRHSEDLGQPTMPLSVDFGRSNAVPEPSSSSGNPLTAQLYRCTSDSFVIKLAAGYPQHLPTAMRWICAALRLYHENLEPQNGVIYKSHGCNWHEEQDDWDFDFLAYGLHPLKQLKPEEYGPNSCWNQLFTPGMAVWYPSYRRPWGKGLGMSFAMLCHLSAARDYLWISDSTGAQDELWINEIPEAQDDDNAKKGVGGYILGGFRTAAIPIRHSKGGSLIQWHLETVDTDKGHINHCNLQSTRGEWLKIQDLSGLQHTKVFLGWCREAEILLGTDQLTRLVKWSYAKEQERTLHRAGYSMGVAAGPAAIVTSPAQLAASIAMTMSFVSNIQVYKPSKEYADALSDDCEKTAIVIDHEAKRAFLVPKLSLVLHLCYNESRRVYRTSDAPIEFPTAPPSVDGAEAAHQALRDNGDKIVIGVQGRGDATTLEMLLLRIYHTLKTSAGNSESPKRLAFLGTKIYGREIRSIMERPDGGCGLSVVQDYRLLSWVRLAQLADVVCVCSNLGSAIQPVFANG